MAYTFRFACGTGMASCTFSYVYNGVSRTASGATLNFAFDEGSTVRLTGYSFLSGYGYPATITNLGTGGTYTYTYAGSTQWVFNSSVGGAPPSSGYYFEATPMPTTYYYVTLLFNANGGSGAPASQTYRGTSSSIPVFLPTTIPTRSGYTFLGWSTSSTATAAQYVAGGYYSNWWGSTDSGYSQTLYAVWQAASYSVTVRYNANGGSGAPASHTESGTSSSLRVTLSAVRPTRSGYTFLGWSISSTAASAEYAAGQTLNNVYAAPGGYTWTLYAVWSKESVGGVYLGNGSGFYHYTLYIWSGGWKKAVPYIWNGGWKKGT